MLNVFSYRVLGGQLNADGLLIHQGIGDLFDLVVDPDFVVAVDPAYPAGPVCPDLAVDPGFVAAVL